MIAVSRQHGGRGRFWSVAADLTPMIDVLFMLLIFMVLTANSAQVAITGSLPSTEESGLPAPEQGRKIDLTIQSGAEPYIVDGQAFADWDQARTVLEELMATGVHTGISLMVDPAVPVQRLVDAMAYSQSKGISETDIVLEMR